MSMTSVHSARTAPGARMLSDISSPFRLRRMNDPAADGMLGWNGDNATNDWGGRARLTLQRGDEIVGPADDVAVAHDDVQRLPARLAFAQRHVERGPQCAGDLFVIERIDEQRFGHLLGGAGDRKSTRRTPVTNAHLVCRLL